MKQLWAPWRMAYIAHSGEGEGCFLCRAWEERTKDEENLVLGRGLRCFAILNRFPYNGGHILIAPGRHIAGMADTTSEEVAEMWRFAVVSQAALTRCYKAEGFNLGINLGACSGAGVPGHLHMHVVPRWSGDTNFLAVFADVKVIPQALADAWRTLHPHFAASGE